METIQKHVRIEDDGKLIIDDLPLKRGQEVDVLIRSKQKIEAGKYPLRGKAFKLVDPFSGIDEGSWSAMQ